MNKPPFLWKKDEEKLDSAGINRWSPLLMDLFQWPGLKAAMTKDRVEGQMASFHALFEQLNLKVEFFAEELKRIPKEGKFIAVSNHPYGMLDALIALYVLQQKRSDSRALGPFPVPENSEFSSLFIPTPNKRVRKRENKGMAHYGQPHLDRGEGLIVFPAGSVSSVRIAPGIIRDNLWGTDVIQFIQKAQVPVVPLAIHGSHLLLQELISRVFPGLTSKGDFPVDVDRKITVRIGKAINPKEQAPFTNYRQLGRYLRQQVYFMEKPLPIRPLFRPLNQRRQAERQEPIAPAMETRLMQQEIEQLSERELVLTFRDFSLYLAKAEQIPYVIQEIGRLREITFRDVGEGSNKPRDLDEYDLYAHHLILWDTSQQCLVGAYRLGFGNEIMRLHGSRGMYFTSLFKIGTAVEQILPYTIELGRAFIVKAYQNKPYPLFLLWKGLSIVMLKNPDYRYFMGCVSISNAYSKYSKSLLMEFIRAHYFDHGLAMGIKPRKRFRAHIEGSMKRAIKSMSQKDVQAVDQFIEHMEPGGMKMPVLLKKYLKQNAKIIGFNVDPDFNNALDGLMILDLFNLPLDTVEQAVDSISDPSILDEFKKRAGIQG